MASDGLKRIRIGPPPPARRSGRARPTALGLAAIAATLAAGCSIISSESPFEIARRGEQLQGLAYTFPTGVIDVKLSVVRETARFNLTVGAPRFIGRPEHAHVIRYKPHISFEDVVEATVNGQGFLQTITLTSTDKTDTIILNVVGAAVALNPFETEPAKTAAGTEVTLAEHVVDPTRPDALAGVMKDLNAHVLREAERATRSCWAQKLPDQLSLQKRAACLEYGRLASSVRRWKANPRTHRPPVWLHLERPVLPTTAKPADCSVGICYRPALPYRLWYALGNGQASLAMDLPNEAPPVEIDMARAFLVTKSHTVVFHEKTGLLKSVYVKKPSELLAASKLPLQVVGAIGKALELRVKLVEAQTGSINAHKQLIEAQRKARLESRQLTASAGAPVSNIATTPAPRASTKTPAGSSGPREQDFGLENTDLP